MWPKCDCSESPEVLKTPFSTFLLLICKMTIRSWGHTKKIFCATLLPNFYPVNLQHSSCKHVFQSKWKRVLEPDQMASFIRSQLIWIYRFSKKDESGFSSTRIKSYLKERAQDIHQGHYNFGTEQKFFGAVFASKGYPFKNIFFENYTSQATHRLGKQFTHACHAENRHNT